VRSLSAGLGLVTVLVASVSPSFTAVASSARSSSGHPEQYFVGVSCPSASDCMAVGDSTKQSGHEAGLLTAVGHGKTWSMEPAPTPTGDAVAYFSDVSCSAPSACLATGFGSVSAGDQWIAIAEYWNGTAWSVVSPPGPAGASGTALEGVSCNSATSCLVVGETLNSTDTASSSLAELWNGTTWVIEPTPQPVGSTGSSLSSVSCISPIDCTAVGSFASGATNQTLVENWNGTSWSIETTPNPSGATVSGLLSVSCKVNGACDAVGASQPKPGHQATLGEHWNGQTWSIEPTPEIPDAQQSTLFGVSCVKLCIAVGSYTPSTDRELLLVEVLKGGTWSITAVPGPPGATNDSLGAISCGSSTACVAVGGFNYHGPESPLIERRNGKTWVVQSG
jgi:hypothetical protein